MNHVIIGGGHSVSKSTPIAAAYDRGTMMYGVNDAAIYAPVDIAVTMDRLWFENRYSKLHELGLSAYTYVRRKCDCNVKDSIAQVYDHKRELGLSTVEGLLYGSNSGMIALNLAFQTAKRGDKIFLLGFDMQKGPHGEPYWYPPYPWASPEGGTKPGNYRDWIKEFTVAAQQLREAGITVYNVVDPDHPSLIQDFQKVSIYEWEKLL